MDSARASGKIPDVTAIRVIFDGKAFIPQQPVSLPDQSEALVIVEDTDPKALAQLDADVRASYQTQDADDDAWANATAPKSHQAMITMRVSAWSGGNNTYGIRIGKPNRDAYFSRDWTEIVLHLDGREYRIPLTDGFWKQCPEIRSPVIRDWFLKCGLLDEWPKGKPPTFEMVSLGRNNFCLVSPPPPSPDSPSTPGE